MMKWFIACLIIIYIGLSLSIGMLTGLAFTIAEDKIAEVNRESLLAHYDIQEE